MKNLTLLYILIFIAIETNATVRTVAGGGGGQYSDFNAAYNASSNGDTLMLEPFSGSYYAVDIHKSLTFIGVGYNPQKSTSTRSVINPANLCCGWVLMSTATSGSKFFGIEFSSGFVLSSGNGTVNNILFENCKIPSISFGNSWGFNNITFRNCIFEGNDVTNMEVLSMSNGLVSNILVTNCVFDGRITGNFNSPTNFLVEHCVFLSSITPLFNIVNLTIQNSIFMNCTSIQTASPNVYTNNIIRLSPWSAPNIGNTDPGFVSYSPGSFYSSSFDFNVTHSSAITGATDGTQIGVNGGTSKFNESGEPLIIPIVRSLQINNTSVAPAGTINVKVKASKPNDN